MSERATSDWSKTIVGLICLCIFVITVLTATGLSSMIAQQAQQVGREEGASPFDSAAISFEIAVRPTDIDEKGHVNNARYLEYMQFGRWDWFSHKQVRIDSLADVVLVVVNVNLNYKREIRFGEPVFVQTSVEHVGDKSVTFFQAITGRMGDVRAGGTVTLVAVDRKTKKSTAIPMELRRVLERKAKKL